MDAFLRKKQEREAQRKEQESKFEKELEAIRREREQKEKIKDSRKGPTTNEAHIPDVNLEERRLERERLKKQLEEQRLKEEQDRYFPPSLLFINIIFLLITHFPIKYDDSSDVCYYIDLP